jgi:hypothetical protein
MRLLALILWFISCSSVAAIHVCTDADGRKLFTDGDCPSGTLLNEQMGAVSMPRQSGSGNAPAPVGTEYRYVGHPMNLDQPKEVIQRSNKHANFASIWASKLQLGFLSLFFMFVVAASGLFLLAYLFLMLSSRITHKRQREAEQNIQPDLRQH